MLIFSLSVDIHDVGNLTLKIVMTTYLIRLKTHENWGKFSFLSHGLENDFPSYRKVYWTCPGLCTIFCKTFTWYILYLKYMLYQSVIYYTFSHFHLYAHTALWRGRGMALMPWVYIVNIHTNILFKIQMCCSNKGSIS